MAKVRNDTRNNATRGSNSRKTEKWEVMKGWLIKEELDDMGIECWAKKRRQSEEKSYVGRRRAAADCDPYMCSIIGHCDAIDDISSFKDDLLSEFPNYKPFKLKSSQNENQISSSTKSAEQHTGVDGTKQNTCENKDENGTDDPENIRNGANTNSDSPVQKDKMVSPSGTKATITSAAARAKRLIAISQNNNKSATGFRKDYTRGQDEEESPESHSQTVRKHSGYVSETNHNQQTERFGISSITQIPSEQLPPPIKLSYSQSNITLMNPYTSVENLSSPLEQNDGALPAIQTSDKSLSPANATGDESSKPSRTNTPGLIVTSLSDLKGKVSTLSDTSLSNKSISPEIKTEQQSDSQPVNIEKKVTFAISDTLSSKTPDDDTEHQNSAKKVMSQKQISLVLKKVTLKDCSGMDLPEQESIHPVIPLMPSSAAKSQHISEKSVPLYENEVPIGELLPVVEGSMNTPKVQRHKPSPCDKEDEIHTLQKESVITDRLLSYEDSLIMMKEGFELMRLKEQQQSMLGPPAFRPQVNKTPLQRAKDNTSKRLHGPNNGNTQSYSDISQIRWQSSSGIMYSANTGRRKGGRHGPEEEVRSAPITGRMSKSGKSSHSRTVGQGSAPLDLIQLRNKLGSRMIEVIRRRTAIDFRNSALN